MMIYEGDGTDDMLGKQTLSINIFLLICEVSSSLDG